MKFISTLCILLFLTACKSNEPTFLEGEWRSNKELTIKNYTNHEKLTEDRKEFLNRELGKLTMIFKGNETAIYFKGDEVEDGLEWASFEAIKLNEESFSLSVTNSYIWREEFIFALTNAFPLRSKFTYRWSENCFYQDHMEWGFHEYFCKVE